MNDLPALIAALMAGLLGSGHCFGMCGGIAGSLGAISGMGQGRSSVFAAIQFNAGRLLSYMLLGMLAAGILGSTSDLVSIQPVGRWLRAITAVLILMLGLRFLIDWRGLDWIERGGARIWKRVMPVAVRISQRNDATGRIGLGLCWGLLPCGLVYTILLTAASTGQAVSGALIMLAFGVGTLPSMLGMTLTAPALGAFLSDRLVRRIVGFSLIVLALWVLVPLFLSGGGHHAHHH